MHGIYATLEVLLGWKIAKREIEWHRANMVSFKHREIFFRWKLRMFKIGQSDSTLKTTIESYKKLPNELIHVLNGRVREDKSQVCNPYY